MSKSNYVLSDCCGAGLGSSPVENYDEEGNWETVPGTGGKAPTAPEENRAGTIKDTIDEAKKYANNEIPLWVKVASAVGGFLVFRKFTKKK